MRDAPVTEARWRSRIDDDFNPWADGLLDPIPALLAIPPPFGAAAQLPSRSRLPAAPTSATSRSSRTTLQDDGPLPRQRCRDAFPDRSVLSRERPLPTSSRHSVGRRQPAEDDDLHLPQTFGRPGHVLPARPRPAHAIHVAERRVTMFDNKLPSLAAFPGSADNRSPQTSRDPQAPASRCSAPTRCGRQIPCGGSPSFPRRT